MWAVVGVVPCYSHQGQVGRTKKKITAIIYILLDLSEQTVRFCAREIK